MKNIGIVCYPTFGGSGIIASQLGLGLTQKYNVHFICYEKPVKLDFSVSSLFFHKVNVPIYPLFEYPPYELALTARIVEVVQKHHLDIIHVHYAIPHAYAALNAKRILLEENIKIPIITTLHGTDITLVGKSPYIMSAVNYAINNSSIVTAVSSDLKAQTLKYFNVQKEIVVIPNFINISQDKKLIKKHNESKIISHISNFRPVKRVFDVINIFENILKKIDSKLIMVGDGPDLQQAKDLVYEKGLSEVVQFIGVQKDVSELLRNTDLFLLPSKNESFGLVALEAMSFGVPVIATCSGGVTELVINGFNGYTCDVGDVVSMSQRSVELLLQPKLYQTISFNAHETAQKYAMHKIVPLYEKCYQEALK